VASGQNAFALGRSTVASATNAVALGYHADATASFALAFGNAAQATDIYAMAFGATADASGNSSLAFGRGSNASGDNAMAFGRDSTATTDAVAFGRDSNAAFDNSFAFGTGVSTTFANQMAFGGITNIYTFAGITSAASLANQGTVTGLITTDASGNLASDGGALEGRVTSLEGGAAEELDTKATGMRDYANTLQDDTGTIASDDVDVSDAGVSDVDSVSDSIGGTTITGTTAVSREGYQPSVGLGGGGTAVVSEGVTYVANDAIFNTMATNADNIATNAEGVATNAGRINVNSGRIANNVALINANSGLIASNTDLILQNTDELKKATRGIAGVAALPDMFLASDETMAISGGVGFFGDQIGLGVTAAQRLNNNWSFGASIAVADDVATGKLQARWSR